MGIKVPTGSDFGRWLCMYLGMRKERMMDLTGWAGLEWGSV